MSLPLIILCMGFTFAGESTCAMFKSCDVFTPASLNTIFHEGIIEDTELSRKWKSCVDSKRCMCPWDTTVS